jgi:phosphomannomutase
MTLLNGNQTMILMTAFLLEKWKNTDKINGNQFVGSTIVSTPMMMELATSYGVECKVGLTGFKWIAKMIKDFLSKSSLVVVKKVWIYGRRCST